MKASYLAFTCPPQSDQSFAIGHIREEEKYWGKHNPHPIKSCPNILPVDVSPPEEQGRRNHRIDD